MMLTSTISADLMTPGFPPLVYAVQGEQYSRQIEMHLYDGGLPWTVPGGVYIAMRYSKPDGTKGYYDTLPDGSQAWSVSGNRVSIFVAPQMLAVPGFVTAQLEIILNQSILATFSLRLKVEANPAAALQQSEDYVNWLKWMEDQLKQALKEAADSGEFDGPPPDLTVNTIQYQVGSSDTTPPSGQWLNNIPSVPQGKFLWTKHTQKWNNSDPVTAYSIAYQGEDGTDAQLEIDTVEYQISASGDTPPSGSWLSTIPTPQPGKFLWTRRTKKWNTGTARTDYSVAYSGTNGIDGTPATIRTQKLEYQVGPDGETPPSGAWVPNIPTVPQGQFLWVRYTVQFNTGSPMVIQIPAYQGLNGTGSVASVAGVMPTPDGNVPLTAEKILALPVSGGSMDGPIQMNGQKISGLNDPTQDTEPATRGFVNKTYLSKSGGAVSGPMTVQPPIEPTNPATKKYVDSRSTWIPATLGTSWTGSGPYTQTVSVPGIPAEAKAVTCWPDWSADAATRERQREAWNAVSRIVPSAGAIAFTCDDDKPVTAVPMRIEVQL